MTRYRPRYLPKEKENWNHWWKEDLAPSKDLWKSYIKDKKIEWPEYKRRYIDEIQNNHQPTQLLKILSSFVNDYEDKNKHIQSRTKTAGEISSFNPKI